MTETVQAVDLQAERLTKLDFKVDQAWETNLEPGMWYRIVDAVCPRIICGHVFVDRHGVSDYRQVDGKKISPKLAWYELVTREWEDAISRYKKGE